MLGVLYVLAATAAIGASALIDGGVFWNVMIGTERVDAKTVQGSGITLAMLTGRGAYIRRPRWRSGSPRRWSPGRAWAWARHCSSAFMPSSARAALSLLYALGWSAIGVVLPLLISTLLGKLTGSPLLMMMVLLPMSIVLTVVMYCSFYPTYTTLFGKPSR